MTAAVKNMIATGISNEGDSVVVMDKDVLTVAVVTVNVNVTAVKIISGGWTMHQKFTVIDEFVGSLDMMLMYL